MQPGLGVRGLLETIQGPKQPIVGIVDGGCSSVTTAVSGLARWYNYVSVSGVAVTPMLSDKYQFPSFLRTVDSIEGTVPSIVALCLHNDWMRVTTIQEDQVRVVSLRALPARGVVARQAAHTLARWLHHHHRGGHSLMIPPHPCAPPSLVSLFNLHARCCTPPP